MGGPVGGRPTSAYCMPTRPPASDPHLLGVEVDAAPGAAAQRPLGQQQARVLVAVGGHAIGAERACGQEGGAVRVALALAAGVDGRKSGMPRGCGQGGGWPVRVVQAAGVYGHESGMPGGTARAHQRPAVGSPGTRLRPGGGEGVHWGREALHQGGMARRFATKAAERLAGSQGDGQGGEDQGGGHGWGASGKPRWGWGGGPEGGGGAGGGRPRWGRGGGAGMEE